MNNLFKKLSNNRKPINFISAFSTWTSTDDFFYYNFVKNKDKGLAKKKITFRQILIIQSSSILSKREQLGSRYNTRYQATRNNNSSEESPDDNDNDDDDNNSNQGNNPLLNYQPLNQLSNQPSNMNQGNEENNLPDREQNNVIAQVLAVLVQVIENIQPAPANRSREQNIA